MTKLKNSKRQNSKTQIVTKRKTQIVTKLKTQNVTKLKQHQNSKGQIEKRTSTT